MLDFICNNYMIVFNEILYKQTAGVPMGTRFSSPYAVIYMHQVETEALAKLPVSLQPSIYVRYIDDIIFAFNDHSLNKTNHTKVLNCFNSIDPNIKFTIETPDPITNKLPFLDITIQIDRERKIINIAWFQKSMHSGNMLHSSSHLSVHIKKNFIINRFTNIFKKKWRTRT